MCRKRPLYELINAGRGLFISALLAVVSLAFAASAHAQTAPDASGYRLIGIVSGKDLTGAVLDDSSGLQMFYRIRDELPDGSRIVKVCEDSIALKRTDGSSFELFIIHDMKPSAGQPGRPAPVAAGPVRAPAPASYTPPRTPPVGGWNARPDRRGADRQASGDRSPRSRGSDRQNSRIRRSVRE